MNISFELSHKPIHKIKVRDENKSVESVAALLQRMGYATLVYDPKSISKDYSITCTRPCHLYQHQISTQTSLMALVAKKFRIKYDGWTLK